MPVKAGRHSIELVGEVRGMTLNDDGIGGAFQLRLDDGATVAVDFGAEHEPGIVMALLQRTYQRLKITGLGDFSADGKLRRVCRLDTKTPARIPAPAGAKPATPGSAREFIEEWIAFGKTIPEEELAKFPTDFAENMDHYMYGLPKRGEE